MEWNGSGGRGAWKSDLSSPGSWRSHLSYRGLCHIPRACHLYHRSILNAALPRRINTAYRPRIYPYLSISSPRVKTCTLQLKCRFVVERGIKNTLVEQCGQRLDAFKEASRCFCFEKEIESLEFLQSRIRVFFFFKNLSRWKIGSVVRIYVWKKEIFSVLVS